MKKIRNSKSEIRKSSHGSNTDSMKKSNSKSGIADRVSLHDVERELSRRMKVVQGPGESPILGAHMSNLIIYCDRAELAEQVSEEIPEIVASHPARVLLLIAEPGVDTGELVTTVTVRGRVVDPGRWVCSEIITLHAKSQAAERLPYAVRSLLIGDLPTNLWWAAPQPPSMAGQLLYELAEHAQQIIYDSIGWVEPPKVMAATASWLKQFEARPGRVRWRVASDLNWRRLKHWRRMLSQTLDPATAPGAVESLTEVLLEHGPHAVIQAWGLAGWLVSRLGWQVQGGHFQEGEEISWQFRSEAGIARLRIRRLPEGTPEIHHMRLACTFGGKPGAFDLKLHPDRRLSVMPEGVVKAEPRTLPAPVQSRAELISRQLSDRERDPVFQESMAVALLLAQRLLGS
jgi:glucose-6-phosphate dehydrogenase assembly protein OpcA